MITGPLRSRVDKLWEEFWTGGITNPLTVIEQISFLMFARLLDIREKRNEKKSQRLGAGRVEMIFNPDEQHLRWGHFRNLSAQEMLPHVRDKVFPHFRKIAVEDSTFGEYMKDAQLMIQKHSLLVSAVNMIDALPLTEGDTKGDLYEYLLSKLTTAGINGQFRTPRHIIRLMVEMLDPKPTEVVGDPACGTAGFLVGTMQYLLEKHTSLEGILEEKDEEGGSEPVFTGDLLEPYRDHIQKGMFHGFDFDATMLRIAAMNLMLHDVETPDIHYQDTLSNSFIEHFPRQSADFFDVILANPPFKGSLDYSDVHPSLTGKVKTKKTELLFLVLMHRMLKLGGRCATIVPDGVLFGSSKAHLTLRTMLVDENQLEGIISLPSGVFRPYAGVSTAIIIFTKGGKTEQVFFFDVRNDGYSLDDKREPIDERVKKDPTVLGGDLPDTLDRWRSRDAKKHLSRIEKAFFIPVSEIRTKNYDLSVSRYKEVLYEEEEYDPPETIVRNLREVENKILQDLNDLDTMVKG